MSSPSHRLIKTLALRFLKSLPAQIWSSCRVSALLFNDQVIAIGLKSLLTERAQVNEQIVLAQASAVQTLGRKVSVKLTNSGVWIVIPFTSQTALKVQAP
jgi:hypothetical protein